MCIRDRAQYTELLRTLAGRLDSLYALDVPEQATKHEKAALIAKVRSEAKSLDWQTDAYSEVDRWVLNNARLSLFRTYHAPTDLFHRVRDAAGGLPNAIRVFEACEGQRNPEAYLEAWLERKEASE